MKTEVIANQVKRTQYETERRKKFIRRMEHKLIIKQRQNTHTVASRGWFTDNPLWEIDQMTKSLSSDKV